MARLNASAVRARQLQALRSALAGRAEADPEILSRSFGLSVAEIRFELGSMGVKDSGQRV